MPTEHALADIVFAAGAGDDAAWAVLYHHYHPSLLAEASSICGSVVASKDIVQDSFVTAFLKLHQLNDPRSFGGWMMMIVRRRCYRYLRSLQQLPLVSEMPFDVEDEYLANVFDQSYSSSIVHSAVARLSENLRVAVVLRYFTQFNSYQQIAEVLSIPVGTVRSRLNEARLRLCKGWQQVRAGVEGQNKEWDQFYFDTFSHMHHSDSDRLRFVGHLKSDVTITANAGQSSGRLQFEKRIDEDRRYGSWLSPVTVTSSGDLSVIESCHYNSCEHPKHCPSSSLLIIHRVKGMAERMAIHAAN